MKKAVFFVFLFLYTFYTSIGSENVPSKITFANLKLNIKPEARQIIGEYIAKLKQNEAYFQSIVKRADLYFPIVEEKFREIGVPDDIKYLCIQESELVATAVSSSKAVGYWQFKKATAQEVGLTVDNTVDERKNIASASLAAAKYLKNNNKRLDNWAYALLSYNTGLTGVRKYTENKYLGASTMDITRKTHWYLLKFISHKLAFEHEVGKQQTEVYLKEDKESLGSSIAKMAKKHKVDKEDMLSYNVWIPYEKKIPSNIPVIIPLARGKEKVITSKEKPEKRKLIDIILNRESIDYDQLPSLFTVNGVKAIIARSGESLKDIAEKVGKEEEDLLKYNELVAGRRIKTNEHYFIEKKKKKALVNFHTVKKGETLASIAQQYGVVQESILKFNRMNSATELKENRILWMRKKRPKASRIMYEEVTPTTKTNDAKEIKPTTTKEELPIQEKEVMAPVEDTEEIKNDVKEIAKSPVVSEEKQKLEKNDPTPKDTIKEDIEITKEKEDITIESKEVQEKVVQDHETEKEIEAITKNPIENKEVAQLENNTQESIDTAKVLAARKPTQVVAQEADEIEEEIVESKVIPKEVETIPTDTLSLASEEEPSIPDEAIKTIVKDSNLVVVETKPSPKSSHTTTHTVAKGETLYSISKKYELTVERIKEINDLKTNALSIGQVLKISKKPTIHTVVKGDTFYSISKKYNISVKELQDLNDKKDFSLAIGEVLHLTKQ